MSASLPVDTTERTGGDDTVLLHGARLSGAKELVPVIREVSRISKWRGLAAIAFDWLLIAGCFAVALCIPHFVVWGIAAVLVAARQHALLVLMHDATHYRIVRNRVWNDRISDWLLAWPLFVTTEGFRRDHLPHHFHLFTNGDSEWTRKQVRPEFQFPFTRGEFLLMLLKDLLGFSVIKMFRLLRNFSGAQQQESTARRNRPWSVRLARPAYYAALAAALTYFGLWVPYLLLWVMPAFTLLFAILRVRNVAEHSNVGVRHDLEMSRSVVAPPFLERLLLAPHNVGLHLAHHLYPSVPFYNLPRVHQALMSIPEYAADALIVKSYFGWKRPSVLSDISVVRDNEIDMLRRQRIAAPQRSDVLEATET
jgi:fatty acid desaturase